MTREEYGKAYERGFNVTVRFLLSRGVRPSDRAEDAAQTAWIKGWEKLGQLRNPRLLMTWVNTIALNVYRTLLRREPAFRTLPELRTKGGINLAAMDVGRILKICRTSDRALLEKQISGLTVEEIAREFGVTETAVRIRFVRARRAARARVEKRARETWRKSSPMAGE
jgi:DNA-directed RNA polymerase specialized sigma24 family protein